MCSSDLGDVGKKNEFLPVRYDYEALGLFNDALQRALVNVRAFPEAYPRTGKARRRFVFEFRSIPYVVLYAFDGELIVLHDIHFARSAQAAHWLSE